MQCKCLRPYGKTIIAKEPTRIIRVFFSKKSLPVFNNLLQNAISRKQNFPAKLSSLQLVENPDQIRHLLPSRVATLAYSDAFLREAVKQNYSKSWLCETIAQVPITLNDAPFPSSFVLRKNSEFKKLFNFGLALIKERGFHYRYFHNYERFQSGFTCGSGNAISWESVDVADIYVPFSILAVGLVMAGFLCFCENRMKSCLPYSRQSLISHRNSLVK